ncbi:serine/threonine-protein kinase, partial [Streptomonospora algeriensis]
MPTEPSRERPTRVGERYELTSPISTGGMGQVWRGYDTVLDREIAVKLIRPDVARNPEETAELAARFRREAKVTARIEHSAVPAVYDADIDGPTERLYLVMQLVRGVPLSDVIAEDAPLPVETAASIAAQVCSVLSYAHAVPAVHRDLKPSNVLIADEGAVKVLDFGIAAVLRTDVTRLTATGTKLGTFAYMPPEQVLGGGVSPASDLYSLGCVLFELCTGRRVFPGGTDYVVQDQHVKTAPTPPRELCPDLPEALERLILHLLAKNPEERPADPQEVYGRLAPFLPVPASADEAEPAAPPGSLPDPTRPYRR